MRGAFLGGYSSLGPGVRTLPFDTIVADKFATSAMHAEGFACDPNGFRVFWEGVDGWTERDLVSLACNGGKHGLEQAFDAIAVSSPFSSGPGPSGWVDFPALPDLRCNYVARYLRADEGNNVASVVSEVELAHAAGAFGVRPSQIHISFTKARDEMLIIWVSGHPSPEPRVKWGYHPAQLTSETKGTSTTYTASDMCNAPANKTGLQYFIHPGWIHRVLITGLKQGVKVYYKVGNGRDDGWSDVHNFRSRQAQSANKVKFIMYADQALPFPIFAPNWRLVHQVAKDIEHGYDAFLLHPGDLGYAEGSGFIWDLWHFLIEPITTKIPYMVTVGNHEYDHIGKKLDPSGAPPAGWHPQNTEDWGNYGDDSHGECGVPVTSRFNGTESECPGSNGVFWYSFNEGGVHVIVLSSEHDWRIGSKQYQWLEADLRQVNENRSANPWIVLATHRMMYTTQLKEDADYHVSLGMRKNLEPLLYKYKVNLMLVGHQHSYERSCAALKGECVADGKSGTVHIVAGMAGASKEKGGFSPALGNFSLKHVNDYGYLRLDANLSRLHVEFVRSNPHDGIKGGQIWDSVDLLPWL